MLGVKIAGCGIAQDGLYPVSNADVVRMLEASRAEQSKFWLNREKSVYWWMTLWETKDPFCTKYTQRFEETEKRVFNPFALYDWELMFDRYLAERTTTTVEEIFKRTGIQSRHFAKPGIATSDLAAEAGLNTLKDAGVGVADVDAILLATVTPDHPQTPPTAKIVADKLEIPRKSPDGRRRQIFGVDIMAACSGYLAALEMGAHLVATGARGCVLVIGSDVMHTTCVRDVNLFQLLADGAGGLLLVPTAPSHTSFELPGCFFGHAPQQGAEKIIVPCGGSRQEATPLMVSNPIYRPDKMQMNGQEVLRDVIKLLVGNAREDFPNSVIGSALRHRTDGLSNAVQIAAALNQVDLMVFHQSNGRILQACEEQFGRLGYAGSFFRTIENWGNPTTATIPITLFEARKAGVLKQGMRFLTAVVGGGLEAMVADGRWTAPDP